MRTAGLIICIFCVGLAASAQSPVIDNIRQQLAGSSGKPRVDLLNTYGYIRFSYDYVEAKALLDEAYRLATELHYEKGIAEALLHKGLIEYSIGNDSLAQVYYNTGLHHAGDDAHLKGKLLLNIGQTRFDKGQLDSASVYYNQSYQLLKDSLDPEGLSLLYLNMAEYNQLRGAPSRQLECLLRSWEIRKKLPEKHPQVWAGSALASYYIGRGDFKIAQNYIDQSLAALGKDTVNNEEMSLVNKYNAIIQASIGNHTQALSLFAKARKFYEQNPYPWNLATMLMEIGYVQSQAANYETGLKYYFQALKLAEKNHYEVLVAKLHFRVARVYYFLDQIELAEELANKSLDYFTAHQLELEIASADNLLGSVYTNKGQYKLALAHYHNALALRKKHDTEIGIAGILGNLSEFYEKTNNFKKSEEFGLQALEVAERADYALGKCYSYQALGQLYLRMKNYAKAHYFLDKGEAFAKKIHYFDVLVFIYQNKSNLWKELSDYKKALAYSDKYQSLKDSLLNKNVSNRILSMQYDFELDRRDTQIKELSQQHKLQQAELELQHAQIRQQRFVIGVGLIIFASLCVIAGMIYFYYRKVKKLNREIQEQNEEITTQSEELREANETLSKLNRAISEQKEEIQAQAEELTESYQTITRINVDLEEKVNERTAELKTAYNELDTFFYRSSHDFRRPLTTFMGLNEVAKIMLKDPAALELFAKVNDTARNLDKMLTKLQTVSLAGNEALVKTEIHFKNLFEEALLAIHDELVEKKINVTVHVLLRHPFYSYLSLLKAIVQNLLENAVSFSGVMNQKIQLIVCEYNGGIQLIVKDNGQGIHPVYLTRVWEMYFRGNEHSTGNGLGLYIVKKMTDKLKGQTAIESTIHVGTTVTITLPRA
ncbi:MAG: tetratricopeptide repeat protein [Bacteroidetes bacterium]|nr:tetratricopeptide repeat protein [Bacteroidota bacterium]